MRLCPRGGPEPIPKPNSTEKDRVPKGTGQFQIKEMFYNFNSSRTPEPPSLTRQKRIVPRHPVRPKRTVPRAEILEFVLYSRKGNRCTRTTAKTLRISGLVRQFSAQFSSLFALIVYKQIYHLNEIVQEAQILKVGFEDGLCNKVFQKPISEMDHFRRNSALLRVMFYLNMYNFRRKSALLRFILILKSIVFALRSVCSV